MGALETRDFELHAWQSEAVDAWVRGTDNESFRGTLEVVTGGGKTLIALACAEHAAAVEANLRIVVVVPTEALARQWYDALVRYTNLAPADIGLLGAGGQASPREHRAVVAVLNTAARRLPAQARGAQPLMLIVDECHRAGAPTFSAVLGTPARYRLGLSATPDREEVDEAGELITYDEQVVGRELGSVVYRFTLKDAREAGWLPEYTLHHHGVALTDEERLRYDVVSRQVDDAADELRALGGDTSRSRQLAGRPDDLGLAARRWVQLTGSRKDVLYRAAERQRVAARLVTRLFAEGDAPRAILFHERVAEAEQLQQLLAHSLPRFPVGLEHSRLPTANRKRSLQEFAAGTAPVLVSVKSLVEGIDVPAADTGISVASTSSVRQRVQSLGRVLRRAVTEAGEAKRATMHLIYVTDTVDDMIYGKADWTDLTGEKANRYWLWSLGADTPVEVREPPRHPLPTEEQAWRLVSAAAAELPVAWPGVLTGQEYSVSSTGVVHNAFGRLIANPQGVDEMLAAVRGRSGGRFVVTPALRLVLVWSADPEPAPYLAGRLADPFRVADEVEEAVPFDVTLLKPGDPYPGPTDKTQGTFKISRRGGGTIERAVKGGREIAATEGGLAPACEANARAVLYAWNHLNQGISRFFVNSLGHAWYEATGERRFLAAAPEGFAWPVDMERT